MISDVNYYDAPAQPYRTGILAGVGYLLLSFPLGVTWFVLLVTLLAAGVGTAIVWVGVPILAFTLLLTRGIGRLERGRANAMLGTALPIPYRRTSVPGIRGAIRLRLRDPATWRDLCYAMVLFPVGVLEFVVLVALWTVGLQLLAMPFYYSFLPDGAWSFPSVAGDGPKWITVDSFGGALPWMALGVVVCVLAVMVTRWLATVHAKLAIALLGPCGEQHDY
jgi:hypothetical protein